MPLYNLACREPLSPDMRQDVVTAITQTHCDQTGAPSRFVNVVFVDNYPLPAPQEISVLGGVRIGGNRTPETIERLRLAMRNAIADASGRTPEKVAISLIGIRPEWILEGGEIMPEPGAEDQSLAQHA